MQLGEKVQKNVGKGTQAMRKSFKIESVYTGIFKNACFGKMYLTRDGRKAVYLGCDILLGHTLHIEHRNNKSHYYDDGRKFNHRDCSLDIVSEYNNKGEEIIKVETLKILKQK